MDLGKTEKKPFHSNLSQLSKNIYETKKKQGLVQQQKKQDII
jgi:hypothetical protein